MQRNAKFLEGGLDTATLKNLRIVCVDVALGRARFIARAASAPASTLSVRPRITRSRLGVCKEQPRSMLACCSLSFSRCVGGLVMKLHRVGKKERECWCSRIASPYPRASVERQAVPCPSGDSDLTTTPVVCESPPQAQRGRLPLPRTAEAAPMCGLGCWHVLISFF